MTTGSGEFNRNHCRLDGHKTFSFLTPGASLLTTIRHPGALVWDKQQFGKIRIGNNASGPFSRGQVQFMDTVGILVEERLNIFRLTKSKEIPRGLKGFGTLRNLIGSTIAQAIRQWQETYRDPRQPRENGRHPVCNGAQFTSQFP